MHILIGLLFGVTMRYERPSDPPEPPVIDLEIVIENLAQCESSGDPMAYNRLDPETPSYGLLQFKLGTFNGFGEGYNLKHTDIMDPEQQIPIAMAMLEDGLWRHWYNCLRKVYETSM